MKLTKEWVENELKHSEALEQQAAAIRPPPLMQTPRRVRS